MFEDFDIIELDAIRICQKENMISKRMRSKPSQNQILEVIFS